MPEKKTVKAAQEDKREGKSPSTQAGEFVREEMHHIREGKHGARSPEQAIAIGLSKARRAGVDVPPAPEGSESAKRSKKSTAKKKKSGTKQIRAKKPASAKRSRASREALKDEGKGAASEAALSRHAKRAAKERTPSERSAAAKKAAKTKGAKGRSEAAKKAARTRARNAR